MEKICFFSEGMLPRSRLIARAFGSAAPLSTLPRSHSTRAACDGLAFRRPRRRGAMHKWHPPSVEKAEMLLAEMHAIAASLPVEHEARAADTSAAVASSSVSVASDSAADGAASELSGDLWLAAEALLHRIEEEGEPLQPLLRRLTALFRESSRAMVLGSTQLKLVGAVLASLPASAEPASGVEKGLRSSSGGGGGCERVAHPEARACLNAALHMIGSAGVPRVAAAAHEAADHPAAPSAAAPRRLASSGLAVGGARTRAEARRADLPRTAPRARARR